MLNVGKLADFNPARHITSEYYSHGPCPLAARVVTTRWQEIVHKNTYKQKQ